MTAELRLWKACLGPRCVIDKQKPSHSGWMAHQKNCHDGVENRQEPGEDSMLLSAVERNFAYADIEASDEIHRPLISLERPSWFTSWRTLQHTGSSFGSFTLS
jgi:hypothetical protein